MRTRAPLAIAIAVCVSGLLAHAQTNYGPYAAPAKWNRFNVPAESQTPFAAFQQNVTQTPPQGESLIDELPPPSRAPEGPTLAPERMPAPIPEPMPELAPATDGYSDAPMTMEPGSASDAVIGSEYSEFGSDCGPECGDVGCCRPLPMCRWFGGADVLLWTMPTNSYRNLVVSDATGVSQLNTSAVDPEYVTGFDVFVGRYFCCQRYGFSLGYMLWNPSPQQTINQPTVPGDYRAAMPAWNGIELDPGSGLDSVYNHFDGAAGYRVHRDLIFQGIEANLSCFGIMGARRTAQCGTGLCRGLFRGLGCGRGKCCKGYGGVCGPIQPGCGSCVRVVTSHGLRWFQMDDEFQFAANIDGTNGYQADDLYYDINTKNNLYGYQFGSRLNYCIGCRWNVSVGGKIGIYANDVEYTQRIGTQSVLAYRTGVATDVVNTEDSDTVLSTLGELDFGLGYRICTGWTIHGGYRLFGVTGVATSTDQFASDYNSLASSRYVNADNAIVLQGGYFGINFNW